MDIEGKVIAVLPVTTGTSREGKEWQKGGFVIEVQGSYPRNVAMTLFGDKVQQTPQVGSYVKCGIDIDSHEYNGRWYTEVRCFAVNLAGYQQPQAQPQQMVYYQNQPQTMTAPQQVQAMSAPQQAVQQPQPAPQPENTGLPF